MKIRNLISVSTIIVALLLSGISPPSAAADTAIWNGGGCKAANLNQAGNLGWSQWGIQNPQPIGGNSYFVLCNLDAKDGARTTTNQQFEIGVQYLDAAATPMVCAARSINADATPPTITASRVDTITEPFLFATLTGSGTSSWNTFTVVCALHPQTRLTYISLEGY